MAFNRDQVTRVWRQALRRRSQKAKLTWDRMNRYAVRWLPHPKNCHPYPSQRLGVITQGRSSLHAATHIPANDRALRERLCRYISRPPLAQGRLSLTDEGQVLWKLRSPWRDGTKAFRFDPLVFIERLVAI
ncbi:MAG: hypothetical protein GY930_07155, partial [bacterium]|nr:hypothetical protein [bacterium]